MELPPVRENLSPPAGPDAPAGSGHGPSAPPFLLASAALLLVIFVVDLFVPDNVVIPILYVAPLLVAARLRDQRWVWLAAIAGVFLTFLDLAFERPPENVSWVLIVINRAIAAASLLISAVLLNRLFAARGAIERANVALAAGQRELEQQRLWLEAVLRTLPVGVLISDADMRDVRMNPAAAAVHGHAPSNNLAEVVRAGAPWRLEDARHQPLPLDRSPLVRAIHSGEEVSGEEVTLILPDGRRVVELVAAAPIRDRAGHIVGGVAALIDITHLKSLQEELDRRRREAEATADRKVQFLAAVSHDIRTPANAINLLAELIRRTAQGAADGNPASVAEIPSMAHDLQAAATSMLHLVSDVLDVTRYDFGKTQLHTSDFPLADLLSEQARQHRPLADAKGLALTIDPPVPPHLVLHTDRVKLGRVIANLLGNAVKFTDHGGVTVRTDLAPDDGVTLAVIDTGVGIDAEHLPRVFDEFFQIRNPARDRTKGGSGLGLAIAQRLVESLGGALDVASEPGKGTAFTISLPASTLAAASAAAIPREPSGSAAASV
jgi:PAS domain S-box-containing protein